jgi:hypothetical protein
VARSHQVTAEAIARLFLEEGLRRYQEGHVELPKIEIVTTSYKLAFDEDRDQHHENEDREDADG